MVRVWIKVILELGLKGLVMEGCGRIFPICFCIVCYSVKKTSQTAKERKSG